MTDENSAPLAPIVVSTIQVLSATVQNVVISGIIAYAWLIAGKLDTSMALGALFTIVGIDFANRARVPGSKAAALAFGATGVLSSMFRATGVALILASGLSLASCATVDLKPIRTALDMSKEVYQTLCVPLPESPAAIERCHVAQLALDIGVAAYNEVENHADAGK